MKFNWTVEMKLNSSCSFKFRYEIAREVNLIFSTSQIKQKTVNLFSQFLTGYHVWLLTIKPAIEKVYPCQKYI